LKNLNKSWFRRCQVKFYEIPAPRVRTHARRRACGHARPRRRLTGHDCQSTVATAGPKASAPTFAPNSPFPRAARSQAARNRPAPPANDVAAVRAPRRPWAAIGRLASPPPCPCRGPPCGDARDPLAKARLPIKSGRPPLTRPRAATVRHRSHHGELYLRPPFTANTCCS
jgi:hypothetical protein